MCMLIRYLGLMSIFFLFLFNCLVGCLSMIVWTPAVLDVFNACVCISVFAPVQRWACFTWKDALEIRSLLLLSSHCVEPRRTIVSSGLKGQSSTLHYALKVTQVQSQHSHNSTGIWDLALWDSATKVLPLQGKDTTPNTWCLQHPFPPPKTLTMSGTKTGVLDKKKDEQARGQYQSCRVVSKAGNNNKTNSDRELNRSTVLWLPKQVFLPEHQEKQQ